MMPSPMCYCVYNSYLNFWSHPTLLAGYSGYGICIIVMLTGLMSYAKMVFLVNSEPNEQSGR